MRNRPIVYLAGGMTGLTPQEAIAWRALAAAQLDARGIETLSPMRGHPAEGKVRSVDTTRIDAFDDVLEAGGVHGIMLRDFTDVKRCDALLVNLLGAPRVSIGTAMERAWAYAMPTPASVAIEEHGNPNDGHPMLQAAMMYRHATLDAAIDTVATVLGR